MICNHLFRAELALGDDGRTLTGYAVPFDVEANVDDGDGPYVERFVRGAFRNVVRAPHVVRLCYPHTDEMSGWVGKCRVLREDSRGLWSEFRLDDPTQRTDVDIKAIAYKINDGQLPSLSVSYVPGRTEEVHRDGALVRTRHTVKMIDHVAIVPVGAYPMLEPLAVRAAPRQESSVERWRSWRNGLTLR